MIIHDVHADLVAGPGSDLAIKREQYIPDDFLDELKDERLASAAIRAGNFMRLCAVPVAVHERWLREGFDMTKAPPHEIIARLKLEGLDAFIATNKRV